MASAKGDLVMSGWVMKMPPLAKATKRSCLKKRWLVLWESYHLVYYEDKRMRKQLKEINLSDCDPIRANFRRQPREPVIHDDEFAFSVRLQSGDGREFVFIPENQDEMQRWCDKLESMRRQAQALPPLEPNSATAAALLGGESPNANRPLPPEPGFSSPQMTSPTEHRPYINEEAFTKAVQEAQLAQQPHGMPKSSSFDFYKPGMGGMPDENYVKFISQNQGSGPEKRPYVNLSSDGLPSSGQMAESHRHPLLFSASVDGGCAPPIDKRLTYAFSTRTSKTFDHTTTMPRNFYPPHVQSVSPPSYLHYNAQSLDRRFPPSHQQQFFPPPDYVPARGQQPLPPPAPYAPHGSQQYPPPAVPGPQPPLPPRPY